MIYGVYAIKDVKTTFWKPFVHHNDHSATREFSYMVNSDDKRVADCADDFELWRLGSYDDATGVIESNVSFVCNAISVKKVID